MIDWAALIRSAPPDEAGEGCSRQGSGNKLQAAGTDFETQAVDCAQIPEKCSRVPAVPAVFEDIRPDHEIQREPAGGGGGADDLRAEVSRTANRRLVIDYHLTDRPNAGGSIIGNSGDTFAELVADLRARYGDRLDWHAVREQFEERAAIMEFDAGLPRTEAEAKAAAEARATIATRERTLKCR